MATITELEDDLKENITVNQVFRHNEDVVWPIATTGNTYWHEIKIEFRGFAVGEGDEDVDEPEFMITAQITPGGVGFVRYPVGGGDPPGRADAHIKSLAQQVAFYHRLHDRMRHRVVVICNALDADGDSLWEAFIDSLSSDVRATVLPVMSGISTSTAFVGSLGSPRALMDFFLSKLGSLFTDDPEEIGEKTIVDLSAYWRRDPAQTHWTALKFEEHKIRGKDPWYVTMWRIELNAGPLPNGAPGTVSGGSGSVIPSPGTTPHSPEGAPGGDSGSGGGSPTPGSSGPGTNSPGESTPGTPPSGGTPTPIPNPPAPQQNEEEHEWFYVDAPVNGLIASIQASADLRAAGVIRILQGEPVELVAEETGISPKQLKDYAEKMVSHGKASLEGRLRAGIMGELRHLREQLRKLREENS